MYTGKTNTTVACVGVMRFAYMGKRKPTVTYAEVPPCVNMENEDTGARCVEASSIVNMVDQHILAKIVVEKVYVYMEKKIYMCRVWREQPVRAP